VQNTSENKFPGVRRFPSQGGFHLTSCTRMERYCPLLLPFYFGVAGKRRVSKHEVLCGCTQEICQCWSPLRVTSTPKCIAIRLLTAMRQHKKSSFGPYQVMTFGTDIHIAWGLTFQRAKEVRQRAPWFLARLSPGVCKSCRRKLNVSFFLDFLVFTPGGWILALGIF
jgi:hypothetical protein